MAASRPELYRRPAPLRPIWDSLARLGTNLLYHPQPVDPRQGKRRDGLRRHQPERRCRRRRTVAGPLPQPLGHREPLALRSRCHLPRGPVPNQVPRRPTGARRDPKHRPDHHQTLRPKARRGLRTLRRASTAGIRRRYRPENRMTLNPNQRSLSDFAKRLYRSRRVRRGTGAASCASRKQVRCRQGLGQPAPRDLALEHLQGARHRCSDLADTARSAGAHGSCRQPAWPGRFHLWPSTPPEPPRNVLERPERTLLGPD